MRARLCVVCVCVRLCLCNGVVQTSLHIKVESSKEGKLSLVKKLLSAGADVNYSDFSVRYCTVNVIEQYRKSY